MFERLIEELRKKLVFDENKEYFAEIKGSEKKINAIKQLVKTDFVYLSKPAEMLFISSDLTCSANIAFIDGGIAEIFKSSSFSLQLIRCSCIIYKNKKRVSSHTKEFYFMISFNDKSEAVYSFFGDENLSDDKNSENDFFGKIGKLNKKILKNNDEADFCGIGNFVMELFEFNEIKNIMESGFDGAIVRDGSFDSINEIEKIMDFNFNNKLLMKKNIFLCAAAKTTSLTTTTGESISFVLSHFEPKNDSAWFFPLSENILFARLNPASKYIFRIDILNPPGQPNFFQKNMISYLSFLSYYCADPVFLGYPYGLIEADKNARVSNHEISFLRKRFRMMLGKDLPKLDLMLASGTAHDILDKLEF